MSLSGALSNAYSGLIASSRGAQAIGDNVANALTPSFGRREVVLASSSLNRVGGGVRVAEVARRVDIGLVNARRLADGAAAGAEKRASALKLIEAATGTPGEAGSLSDRVAAFEATLVSAQSRPDLTERLQNVMFAATDLAEKLVAMSGAARNVRQEADAGIASQVAQLNQSLGDVADLNNDIRVALSSGRDANGLMDRRQVLVDQISEIVPLRSLPRDDGQIALVADGGAILLDGKPAEIGFSATPLITAGMTLGNGALSGLTLNGKAIATGSSGALSGGALAANFALRDESGPNASARADAFARDLIERFQDLGIDPTIGVGEAGLFTDDGAFFDPANEIGLAGRINVNPVADPAQGGALWRLRDGMGATASGDVGDATLLTGLAGVLSTTRAPASSLLGPAEQTLAGLAGSVASLGASERLAADQRAGFAAAYRDEMTAAALADGVDTDQEMQRLLLVEQAYAANARVISTVDDMLKTLMRIGQ